MASARDVARAVMVLYVIGFLANIDGKSIKKRGVGEIQLMHDRSKNKVAEERLGWLKKILGYVHTASHGKPTSSGTSAAVQKTNAILVESKQHQLTPGEKTLVATNMANVDILSKVNPKEESIQ